MSDKVRPTKQCVTCGSTFGPRKEQSAQLWNRQVACSAKCGHIYRSVRAFNRDRCCPGCKLVLPASKFSTKGTAQAPKRETRCRSCTRKLYRQRYEAGEINKPAYRWRKRAPRSSEKVAAKMKFDAAKRAGLVVPLPCRDCGAIKAEGHHPNYSRPLDVIWLCRKCHMRLHRMEDE